MPCAPPPPSPRSRDAERAGAGRLWGLGRQAMLVSWGGREAPAACGPAPCRKASLVPPCQSKRPILDRRLAHAEPIQPIQPAPRCAWQAHAASAAARCAWQAHAPSAAARCAWQAHAASASRSLALASEGPPVRLVTGPTRPARPLPGPWRVASHARPPASPSYPQRLIDFPMHPTEPSSRLAMQPIQR